VCGFRQDSRSHAASLWLPTKNIENNPMQSSMVVGGMDALSESCENILTRRANQRHHSVIAQFVKPPMALPIEIAVTARRMGGA